MTRILLTLTLMFASAAFAQPANDPLPDGEAREEAAGAIGGIVVSAKTGEPLRSASVMLQGVGRGIGRGGGFSGGPRADQTFTGIDGRFFFADIPAGNYTIFFSKAGYGTRNSFEFETRLRIGPGEVRDDVVLRMQPSAVVTGRVSDGYGEPLPRATVSVMSRGYRAGEPRWQTVQTERTNDLGEYRLHGLTPGRYLIAAASPQGLSPRGVSYREFATAFYPSGDSPEQASAVKLTWGEELAGVDFQLAPAPETTLQGMVIQDSTGDACGECSVTIQDAGGAQTLWVNPTREGVFVVQGVPPGPTWVLAGLRSRAGGQAVEQIVVPASGTVEVGLAVTEGETISAEVVLENPPELEETQQEEGRRRRPPSAAFITLVGRGPAMRGPPKRANAPVAGGAVEFRSVTPGTYWIEVQTPNGGYLRAVSFGGCVLEQPEIAVVPGVPVSGLKFHIAYDGASVQGVVSSPSDEGLSERVSVLVIPEPGSSPYAQRKTVGVGQEGFRLPGMAPGRYALYALPRHSAYNPDDPEDRRLLEPYVERVTLKKGEGATVDLDVVPDP
jgi:hypothetical protein